MKVYNRELRIFLQKRAEEEFEREMMLVQTPEPRVEESTQRRNRGRRQVCNKIRSKDMNIGFMQKLA